MRSGSSGTRAPLGGRVALRFRIGLCSGGRRRTIATTRDWRGLAADVERASTARGRKQMGRFSIEGLRLHERALRAGVSVEECLIAESLRDAGSARARRLLTDLEDSGCVIRVAPDPTVEGLTGGRGTGALIGLVRVPPARSLTRILEATGGRDALLLVALDVDDPGNVGALTRTALAAGADAMISVGAGDPFHPRAVRTSMGSLFRLTQLRYESVEPLLGELSAMSIRTLGAVARGGTPLPALGGGGGGALFVGSEAFGLPEALRSRLDECVTIPMDSEIDSYSVNAAAAILLYCLRRIPAGGGP